MHGAVSGWGKGIVLYTPEDGILEFEGGFLLFGFWVICFQSICTRWLYLVCSASISA